MSDYTQGVCYGGAAIMKDGQPLTITLEQIFEALQQRDEYRDHLAVIAEMTGNKGDIGAAHEGVRAVIEERNALAAHVESMTRLWMDIDDCEQNSIEQDDLISEMFDVIREFENDATTSLARRDALKQAEGMEGAVLHIRQKALDYDSEHGSTDSSTGTREFPGDGAEYFNEMMELADEIHQQADEIRPQAEGCQ